MKTYRVVATQEDGWWLLRVPELDVVSQVERLSSAEGMARDLIASWLDVPETEVAVDLEVPGLTEQVRRVRNLQRRAAEAQSSASRSAQVLARELVARHHMSVREAAAVLGLSYQRVQQLLSKTADAGTPSPVAAKKVRKVRAEVSEPGRTAAQR